MGELRKDYVLDRYVIISTERGKRPHEFKQEKAKKHAGEDDFARGNEDKTPKEIERYPPDSKDWDIRVFPNQYSAVKPQGNYNVRTDNNYFTFSDSFGYQEVIVDTPELNQNLEDLPEAHIANVFKILKNRTEVNMSCEGIKYVSVFKNYGKDAGTSIKHSHCQLIAYNKIPEIIKKKEDHCKDHCPYCNILNIEKDSLRRCFENPAFISFTPYASRFPFEIWIFPKRHILNIIEFNDKEYVYLAEIMKKILLKLKQLNASYNFYFQYGIEKMHFHIVLTPRLSKWAGFELSTGTIINSMPPENAAEFYRR